MYVACYSFSEQKNTKEGQIYSKHFYLKGKNGSDAIMAVVTIRKVDLLR